MPGTALRVVALLLAPLAAVRAADVTIVRTFPADKGPGYRKPAPDAAGAVGPHHAVILDDRAFVAVDKATGKVVKDLTQHDFWLGVQPVNTLDLQANDPRILYDPLSGRWIAWVQGVDPMNGYLAVSTTSDPTGPWKGVKFPTPPHNYGAKAGLDKNGFYLTLHNGHNEHAQGPHLLRDPEGRPHRSERAGPVPPPGVPRPGDRILPGHGPGPRQGPRRPGGAPEQGVRERRRQAVHVQDHMVGNEGEHLRRSDHPPEQDLLDSERLPGGGPGGPARAGGKAEGGRAPAHRLRLRARGQRVRLQRGEAHPQSRPGILWYEVRVSDGALLQEGLVDDPTCDYLNPSLAVDRDGNIGLGCTRTSEKEFPSVYVMMHAAGDPAGSMGAPVLAVPGTTYYRLQRAGPLRDRLGQLLDDVHRPFGPEPALDLPGVREQHRRSPVVHGLGRLPTQAEP